MKIENPSDQKSQIHRIDDKAWIIGYAEAMENQAYKPRILDEQIERYLSVAGAVLLEGPKWCGKTWTCSWHASSAVYLDDPAGNFQNRRLAELSPDLVLKGSVPRLLDEWQEVPPLWDAVRFEIDKRNAKGQFLLTGSATPRHKGILHSGTGRIARLRMSPMSLAESGDSTCQVSLKGLMSGEFTPAYTGEVSLERLFELIVRGGWPGNLGTPAKDAGILPRQYLRAVIEEDVYKLDGIQRDLGKMELLLRSLARNESTTASIRTLQKDISANGKGEVNEETISAYLDIFNRLFLLDNQKPFSSSGLRSSARVKQLEKRHFSDPSLTAALLQATPEKLMNDLESAGFLFEALCERDLRIYASAMDGKLFHYQDYNGRELDAVVEGPDGEWLAVEIKLGAGQIDNAAKNLVSTTKAMGGTPPKALVVLCGLSNAAYRRPDGVYVVPPTALTA